MEVVFIAAVGCWRLLRPLWLVSCRYFGKDDVFVLMNDGFYVCYGAVTYFYSVFVKYCVEFTGCLEMLVN